MTTYIRTVVRTSPTQTVVQVKTVTAAAPAPIQRTTTVALTQAAPAAPPANPGASTSVPTVAQPVSGSGTSLNDRGYALMQQGNYTAALPLLQSAVKKLRGVGYPYEAYANYNLGYTLYALRHCAQAIPYLQRAQKLEPQRPEPGQVLARARTC
jgi:TolA-binding protein